MARVHEGRRSLVLGGVRSGKSAFAERLIGGLGTRPVFIATAEAFDDEMKDRIRLHRVRRAAAWDLIEAPIELPAALATVNRRSQPALVDCLSLWVSNLLMAERDLAAATDELVDAVRGCPGPLALVSSEVGLGGVAPNALARRFADALGTLHQRLAAEVEEVVLVAAGLPLWLKR